MYADMDCRNEIPQEFSVLLQNKLQNALDSGGCESIDFLPDEVEKVNLKADCYPDMIMFFIIPKTTSSCSRNHEQAQQHYAFNEECVVVDYQNGLAIKAKFSSPKGYTINADGSMTIDMNQFEQIMTQMSGDSISQAEMQQLMQLMQALQNSQGDISEFENQMAQIDQMIQQMEANRSNSGQGQNSIDAGQGITISYNSQESQVKSTPKKEQNENTGLIVGLAVGGLFIIVLGIGIYCCIKSKKVKGSPEPDQFEMNTSPNKNLQIQQDGNQVMANPSVGQYHTGNLGQPYGAGQTSGPGMMPYQGYGYDANGMMVAQGQVYPNLPQYYPNMGAQPQMNYGMGQNAPYAIGMPVQVQPPDQNGNLQTGYTKQ